MSLQRDQVQRLLPTCQLTSWHGGTRQRVPLVSLFMLEYFSKYFFDK
jgi:hypothetical protein